MHCTKKKQKKPKHVALLIQAIKKCLCQTAVHLIILKIFTLGLRMLSDTISMKRKVCVRNDLKTENLSIKSYPAVQRVSANTMKQAIN